MFGIKVHKDDDQLVVKWQLSTIRIPLADIVAVEDDDTYSGDDPAAFRIGTPYGTTDRVLIKTRTDSYLLYTTNGTVLKRKINSYIE